MKRLRSRETSQSADSCWLWSDKEGSWATKNDTLILYNTKIPREEMYKFTIHNWGLKSFERLGLYDAKFKKLKQH